MVRKEIPMDTGNVLDLFRDRIAAMTADDIVFLFNTHFANTGETLIFQDYENFVLETKK
ncbi:hypothetical protein HN803_04680 [candidate division WWE3 bacterium]|mgnify:CR=1 FL=1|jgi:hypothetical protein|nr:hypothetical protein [candidate division WWE3 bacterium]